MAHLSPRTARHLPAGLRRRIQPVRFALALLGLVVTFGAAQLTTSGSYGFYLGEARAGFWAAVVGFALLAVSAFAPGRRRLRPLTPLLWISPAILLIGIVVLSR